MTESPRPTFSVSAIRDLLTGIRRRLPLPRQPEVKPPKDLDAARLRVQVQVIRRAFGEQGVAVAPSEGVRRSPDDTDIAFLYRPGHVLVREQDFGRVAEFINSRRDSYKGRLRRVGQPTEGLALLRLPSRLDGADTVLATLEELDGEMGEGIATPDHILYVSGPGRLCPATEPELPRRKVPLPVPSEDEKAGDGVRVAVVDSGLWEPAVTSATTPWMAGVLADPTDVETVNAAAIHPYAGHGTFVAGVVRCMAPATRVEVEGVLTNGGAVYESEICEQLEEALREEDHPQLISISAGTHSRRALGLLAFEMLAAAHGLDDGEETLVIAAAGNDGSDEPFWPAAFPWVVSVGSVDSDNGVSDYSNVGDWVDLYARGRDLVNAFPVGTYTCYEPDHLGEVRTFKGLAQWSGTSFSTPVVTGLVAAQMSASGDSARTAYRTVLSGGTTSTDPRGGTIITVGPLS